MVTSYEEIMSKLPEARQKKIRAAVERDLKEYPTYVQFEEAKDSAQAELAKMLNIGQDSIGLIEKQSNLMLSIVGNHVESMGGKLTLTVEFPDHVPVVLDGFTYADEVDVDDIEKLIEHYSDKGTASA